MFKKSLLVASVLGVGAVASGVAFADAGMSSTYCKPGFYAGVQAGSGKTHYGYDDVLPEVETYETNSNHYTLGASHIDDKGTSGRLFAGYQFNPYWAIEAGYTQFHKTDFNVTSYGSQSLPQVNSTPEYAYDGEVTEHATDVVGKLTMPFQYGFGAYLKAGAALVSADRHVNQSYYSGNNVIPYKTFYTKSYQAVRPTYGAGLDYTIPNTSLDVDVSYTEIASGGGIPRASLWALGLSDKFA